MKCKIFFFETQINTTIEVSNTNTAIDVIRHISTIYKHNPKLNGARPLEYPDQPERYQLFIIEEEDSDIEIEYEMGPRNLDEAIGEFPALAFVENKRF